MNVNNNPNAHMFIDERDWEKVLKSVEEYSEKRAWDDDALESDELDNDVMDQLGLVGDEW